MMNAVADPRQPYWHPSWIEPDPHYRAIRREHTKRALLLAKEVGAPRICRPSRAGRSHPGQTWREAADIFYEELMPCVEVAEKLGGRPADRARAGPDDRAFRPVSGIHRADRFAVGRPELRHRPCLLRRRRSAGLGRANGAAYARHYHFEDIAATRVHRHLIPGHGAIDFAATLKAIQATGYDGWITVELYPYIDQPDEAARTAYTYMADAMAKVGIDFPKR